MRKKKSTCFKIQISTQKKKWRQKFVRLQSSWSWVITPFSDCSRRFWLLTPWVASWKWSNFRRRYGNVRKRLEEWNEKNTEIKKIIYFSSLRIQELISAFFGLPSTGGRSTGRDSFPSQLVIVLLHLVFLPVETVRDFDNQNGRKFKGNSGSSRWRLIIVVGLRFIPFFSSFFIFLAAKQSIFICYNLMISF